MSTAFKPLVPGSSSAGARSRGTERDLKVQFKPLGLSGDNLPPAAALQPQAPHSHLQSPPTHPMQAPAETPVPKASSVITRLIRDGDRITHIEVQCSCGEVITLACNYSPADPAQPQ
ncbi:MAG: hypothetical protein ACKOKG_14570 [Verrucomicrobiota bacterium]